MKRLVLVVSIAACSPKAPLTPLERHMQSQLVGDATIERTPGTAEPRYFAQRDEEADYWFDASGNLSRTSITIPGAALPTAVRAAVPLQHISEAKVIFAKGIVVFQIGGGEQEDEWIVDANGKILSYEEAPPDDVDD